MTPVWHPLATLLLTDPPGYLTERLARMLLRVGSLRLRYAGDRMWPALEHGQRVDVHPATCAPSRGSVALVVVDGVPELLRVQRVGSDRLTLTADADPGMTVRASRSAILGRLDGRPRPGLPGARRMRRLALELHEGWRGRADDPREPAGSVLRKYDEQAVFYADIEGEGLDPAVAEVLGERHGADSAVLVIGSGTGRECFGLARKGHRVLGLDFAPKMVELARRGASERGLDLEFRQGDARRFDPGPRRFAAILFTYDVYSFVPGRDERIRMLGRMAGWLGQGGRVLLSARTARSAYERSLLSVQWLSRLRAGPPPEWGASHTRWLSGDGELCRSFVQVFTPSMLRGELRAAGFVDVGRAGSHWILERGSVGSAATMAR